MLASVLLYCSFFLAAYGQCGHSKRQACGCPTCAILANGLPADTLTGDAINWNILTLNGLNQLVIANSTNATMAKALLPFLVSCALNETTVWTSTIVEDGLAVQYLGQLGLAPGLGSNVMNQQEQGLISGCLLARVNYFGKHIEISIRSKPVIVVDDASELTDYSVFEGAFFGNLFSNNTFLKYTCQGEPESQALLESPDRKWRVCTDSSNPCNMVVLGSCNDICQNFTINTGYSNCVAAGQTYDQIMNVFLAKDTSAGSHLFMSLAVSFFAIFYHLW